MGPYSLYCMDPFSDKVTNYALIFEVSQSCPSLSNPMDCSLPGSSIHGIFQARVLEWGAIAFSESHSQFGNTPTTLRLFSILPFLTFSLILFALGFYPFPVEVNM